MPGHDALEQVGDGGGGRAQAVRATGARAAGDGTGRGVVRVVLVAEQSVTRAGLRSILTSAPGLCVVSGHGDPAQALEAVRREQPQVILVGTREGLAVDAVAARQLLAATVAPRAKAILLHPAETTTDVFQVLTGGVHGCLDPAADEEQIVRAVETVAMGGSVFLPAPSVEQAEEPLAISGPTPDEARLTDRERAVLGRLARGLSNSAIARELFLAEATVKKHLTQAMRKIGQPDRLRAGLYAYQHGIFR